MNGDAVPPSPVCPPPESGGLQPLRLGFLALSDCAPLVVARDLGLDRRHGLALELLRENSWAALRDGLIQGRLDAAHCLYSLVYGVHLGIGGARHPMHLLMGLSANGQAICLAQRLVARGLADGPALAAAVRAGQRLTFAQTYPTGTHALWLYWWLASHGIHPLRDVRMITVPPAQMVARLGDGSIDGCCVGEPWGAEAEARQAGTTVATSQQLWPGHPEKVLAASARFASARPDLAVRLIRTLLEACRELDLPGRRAGLAPLVARPEVVDSAPEILLPRFLGNYPDGTGGWRHDPQGLRFFDQGRVNQPKTRDALWFLSQLRRWGLLPEAPDYAATVAAVQQSALYVEAAAALDIPLHEASDSPAPPSEVPGLDLSDPEAYARAFRLRA